MTSKLLNQVFFLRRSKGKEENLSTIYLRITIDGERTEISTQRKCEYSKWNSGAGRVLGKTEEVRELNDHLSSIELRIYSIYASITNAVGYCWKFMKSTTSSLLLWLEKSIQQAHSKGLKSVKNRLKIF